jgi:imidazolonepropionase-like amidohydrolase
MMRRTLLFSAMLTTTLAIANPAAAQTNAARVDMILLAGQLLDKPERAPRGASTILIADGKILEVRDGLLNVSQISGADVNTQVVDLRDSFVLPGLIDSHVHLDSDTAGVEAQLEAVSKSTAAVAYEAAVNARKTLAAGFTTVRNLGDGEGVTLALRDAIAAGKTEGPRIIDAGRSISVTSGHMDGRLGYREDLQHAISDGSNLCDSVESCRRAVRAQIGRGVDVIKIATTGGVNSRIGAGVGQQMFSDEARAIIETAKLGKKKVAVHAHGQDGIQVALAAGADSIEHGTMMDDATIKQMKASGAFLVPTMSTINGYKARLAANPNAYSKDVRAKIDWRISITGKSFRAAHAAGVKIAFGTDAGVSMHGNNADEFELMVEHGMTPAEAIRAATRGSAELLGLTQSVGSLEPGKQADLIAVRSSPLQDVRVLKQVTHVVQNGRLVHSPEHPLYSKK